MRSSPAWDGIERARAATMAVTRRAASGFSLAKLVGLLGVLVAALGVYVFIRQLLVTFDTGLWPPAPLRVLFSPAIFDVAHFPPASPAPAGGGTVDALLDLPASGSLIALGVVLTLTALVAAVMRKIREERRNLRAHYERKGRR